MSTTLNVSLFLPYTIAFHDDDQPRSEAPPQRPEPSKQSSTAVASRSNPLSLLDGAPAISKKPATTTNTTLFGGDGAGGGDNRTTALPESNSLDLVRNLQQLRISATKLGDTRPLVRSDAHVPDWGTQVIFNQPQSRAAPAPSGSILDFARANEEFQARREAERRRRRTHSSSTLAHPPSQDTAYESRQWSVKPAVHGNGGLTNAVVAGVEEGLLETTWIGAVGFPTDALSESLKEEIHDKLYNEHDSIVVYLKDKDVDGHYAHYCKTILWPIFHYQVPDHPKSKAYADHSWEYYRRVNEEFADTIAASYKQGDTIWIHDYHLLLVPGLVRQKLPDAPIGIFLHTAFPSSEVFRCLATRKELLEGMLGANLVAFQTEEYANHFLQTCSRLLTVEATTEGVQLDERFVNVTAEPIGIDAEAMQIARTEPTVQQWIDAIKERYKDMKIIVARDKLDGVHGVRQKLLAYELFLNKNPEWVGKVVLIQVATSASEQSELLSTVSDICTRINAVHSTLASQPLVFLHQDIPFSQYLALLSVAQVLDIAALRDGMGLSAHEYIVCQDGRSGSNKHGPLILSEFAGSHVTLGKMTLSINPWDYKSHAEAIKRALEMGENEKAERWEHLYSIVTKQTGAIWMAKLQKLLSQVHDEQSHRASYAVPRLSLPAIDQKYRHAALRIFILDYEGTLAPHRTSTGNPLSSPQRVLQTLTDLISDARNIVYVMSGRPPEELETDFFTLPTLGLIAENGCFLREFGSQENGWQEFVDAEEVEKWKEQVRGILNYYKDRIEGSNIEERRCSLLFRYDKAEDYEAAVRQAGDCADQINSACQSMRIHAVPINKAILVEQIDFSKGTAATHIFDELRRRAIARTRQGADFMLVAGDDREDETIFEWANNLGRNGAIRDVFTVSVGRRNTVAQTSLNRGTTGLLTVLQKLARTSAENQEKGTVKIDSNGAVQNEA